MTNEQIAMVCHEANRAYCAAIGDNSQQPWESAAGWQRESAINGVAFAKENPTAPNSAQHDNWLREKLDGGWKYGPVKDVEKKEYPCCAPYGQLPIEQQRKDALFKAIVRALA